MKHLYQVRLTERTRRGGTIQMCERIPAKSPEAAGEEALSLYRLCPPADRRIESIQQLPDDFCETYSPAGVAG